MGLPPGAKGRQCRLFESRVSVPGAGKCGTESCSWGVSVMIVPAVGSFFGGGRRIPSSLWVRNYRNEKGNCDLTVGLAFFCGNIGKIPAAERNEGATGLATFPHRRSESHDPFDSQTAAV